MDEGIIVAGSQVLGEGFEQIAALKESLREVVEMPLVDTEILREALALAVNGYEGGRPLPGSPADNAFAAVLFEYFPLALDVLDQKVTSWSCHCGTANPFRPGIREDIPSWSACLCCGWAPTINFLRNAHGLAPMTDLLARIRRTATPVVEPPKAVADHPEDETADPAVRLAKSLRRLVVEMNETILAAVDEGCHVAVWSSTTFKMVGGHEVELPRLEITVRRDVG